MSHLKFKAARQAVNLTQKEAAAALNIYQSFLSRLESGAKHPNVKLLSQMAKLYGVTESDLISADLPTQPVASANTMQTSNSSALLGLQELAADKALVNALQMTNEEWRMLLCLDLSGVTKDGYIQLLTTIRGVSKQ
jgi:transcriptional regulator with XRE-family HTH domain